MPTTSTQRGVAHAIEIVIIALIVLGVGGFVAWRTLTPKPGAQNANTAAQNAITNAACNYEDKDICKFFASWKVRQDMTVNATHTANGGTTTATYKSSGDAFHMTTTINGKPYEVINKGGAIYTKSQEFDWWWVQKTAPQHIENIGYDGQFSFDFEEPAPDKTQYKKVGVEACGDRQCFKYQVIEPASTSTQYMWFDNQSYELRRIRIESADQVSDQTVSFQKVTIDNPTPTRELADGQFIMPGSDTPINLPDISDVPDLPSGLSQ